MKAYHICRSLSVGSLDLIKMSRALSPLSIPFTGPDLWNIFKNLDLSVGLSNGGDLRADEPVPWEAMGVTPSMKGRGPAIRMLSASTPQVLSAHTLRNMTAVDMLALLSMSHQTHSDGNALARKVAVVFLICNCPDFTEHLGCQFCTSKQSDGNVSSNESLFIRVALLEQGIDETDFARRRRESAAHGGNDDTSVSSFSFTRAHSGVSQVYPAIDFRCASHSAFLLYTPHTQ